MLAALTLAVTIDVLPAPASSDVEASTPQWAMFSNGPMRRGYTASVGPESPNMLWRYPTITNYGGPVVGADGGVYVGTLTGQFLAFNPDGGLKWSLTLPYTFESTPAILRDGRIAVATAHGTLSVLNPDGSKSWLFQTGVRCTCAETSPAIGRDGTIYFASGNILYALHPDGTTKWIYDAGIHITGPPAVRSDGIVYIPAGSLVALDVDGSFLWKTNDFAPNATPAIGPDGTIYANTIAGPSLYAIRPNGSLKWRYKLTNGAVADLASSPAIGPDGTVYIVEPRNLGGGQVVGIVIAFNPNGSVKWHQEYGEWATAIAVDGVGTIYVGSTSAPNTGFGAVFAINPDGSLKWEFDDTAPGDLVKTPVAIGSGQRIYAGDHNAFFALGP
jgi:outer membrane protein assembly factor BamB